MVLVLDELVHSWSSLYIFLRRVRGATEEKIPEPIVVDDEFVDHGNRRARSYGF